MTWRDTFTALALWIGVCMVLFYGNWQATVGMILALGGLGQIALDQIGKATVAGFNRGVQSVKPIVISEQLGYKPTFCFADGRVVRVGRDW